MPYVTQDRRTDTGAELPATPGEFNYRISKLCDRMIAEHGLSYNTINGLIGALECAKLELYRRIAVPYEDIKRIQNGEVYTASEGALKGPVGSVREIGGTACGTAAAVLLVKPWYLCGPMSGLPQNNFPVFDAAAAELRRQGFNIVNPAELDSPEVRAASLADKPTGSSWAQFLSRDVILVADQVDGLILLPDWWKSRGARLEVFVALLTGGKDFMYYSPTHKTADRVFTSEVRATMRSFMP